MTTNYTAILNNNLDQLPGYDFPKGMVEMSNGDVLTVEELYDDGDDCSNGCGWSYSPEDGLTWEK